MLNNNLSQISFWLIQNNNHEKTDEATTPVKQALLNFVHLFESQLKINHDFNLTSLELSQIFEHSSNSFSESLYIVGSTSKAKAIQYSWQELGLNLFDLPYNSPSKQKAFYYISLSNLLESWQELQLCFTEKFPGNEKEINLSCEQALEQLQWAKCHQFAKKIQQAVGHGIRDRFQTESWASICESLQKQINPDNNKLPCSDRCGLHQRIND